MTSEGRVLSVRFFRNTQGWVWDVQRAGHQALVWLGPIGFVVTRLTTPRGQSEVPDAEG